MCDTTKNDLQDKEKDTQQDSGTDKPFFPAPKPESDMIFIYWEQ